MGGYIEDCGSEVEGSDEDIGAKDEDEEEEKGTAPNSEPPNPPVET